jgi:hypothetical protein
MKKYIEIKRNGNVEHLLGVGKIDNIGAVQYFVYYQQGIEGVTHVYRGIIEEFEVDGKKYNTNTQFVELYQALIAEIELAGLE